jgi:nucleotide-binding universal stress UspA family protein
MKILAAIDQSEYAGLVLTRALELAEKDSANLTILTVSNAAFTNIYLGEISGDFLEKVRAGAKEAVAKIAAQVKATHKDAEVVVIESPSPADAIVKYAEKNGIDLIVIGNKGAGAIERFLIGSVSSQVVTHAPCSVLVVKK